MLSSLFHILSATLWSSFRNWRNTPQLQILVLLITLSCGQKNNRNLFKFCFIVFLGWPVAESTWSQKRRWSLSCLDEALRLRGNFWLPYFVLLFRGAGGMDGWIGAEIPYERTATCQIYHIQCVCFQNIGFCCIGLRKQSSSWKFTPFSF